MTLEDRRDQILNAVLPAIAEYGAPITSKQLADAAGVAEGTLFRVFGDKDSLLKAAFMQATEQALDIDEFPVGEDASLDRTIEHLTFELVNRFSTMFKLAVVIGPVLDSDRSQHEVLFERLRQHLTTLLEPFSAQLRVSPVVAADVVRSLSFAAATGWGQPGGLSMQEAGSVMLHGIAAPTAPVQKEQS